MKSFQLISGIIEYQYFVDFAKSLHIGERDLLLTNEYIYNPTIAVLHLNCQTCFQEKYGGGEPTDEMVDAILEELRNNCLLYTSKVHVLQGCFVELERVFE